jgi:hypothetical protein
VRTADQTERLNLAGVHRREDLADPTPEGLAGDDRLVDADVTEEQMRDPPRSSAE